MASKSDSKQVIVSIAGVFDAFVRPVRDEEDLRRDVALRARFSAMYANYGTVAYFARLAAPCQPARFIDAAPAARRAA